MIRTKGITSSLIHKAIDNQELCLYYQPQSSLILGKIMGMEALVRWDSETIGKVNPAYFISILEHSGIELIAKFHEWLLRTAFEQIVTWQNMGISVPVYVNFSPIYLQHSDCLDLVKRLILEYGIQPNWFGIEVTESSPVTDFPKMKFMLDSFRALGIQIALDDFCISYSTIEYLSALPTDKIKIDKKFIHQLLPESSIQNAIAIILEALVTMSQKLGIEIVAEGVETVKQLELVAYMGFDLYQGYFLSRPVPADLMTVLIKSETNDKALNCNMCSSLYRIKQETSSRCHLCHATKGAPSCSLYYFYDSCAIATIPHSFSSLVPA